MSLHKWNGRKYRNVFLFCTREKSNILVTSSRLEKKSRFWINNFKLVTKWRSYWGKRQVSKLIKKKKKNETSFMVRGIHSYFRMKNKSPRVLFNLMPSQSKQNTLVIFLNKILDTEFGRGGGTKIFTHISHYPENK